MILHPAARKLPTHHLTIRVPWHDNGWDGTVCRDPVGNTQCLALSRIAEEKDEKSEAAVSGRKFAELPSALQPPCVAERGGFLSPAPLHVQKSHPYKAWSREHQPFQPTSFSTAGFQVAPVPFRWLLKSEVFGNGEKGSRGLAERLGVEARQDREPGLHDLKTGKEHETAWLQVRDNQLAMLDTFFGAVQPEQSLCFFYAKRTPLAEDNRRVIVAVGRVKQVGPSVEYKYDPAKPPLRAVLWERAVAHSVRPEIGDGFVLPYRELVDLADRDPSVRLADFVAFAPEECREQFSYGAEWLDHDGAIASLLACVGALQRIRGVVPGEWDAALAWVDAELNRLWKARGPFPGLGSALQAFGLERGNLIAYQLASVQAKSGNEWTEDPWSLVDAVIDDPSKLPGGLAADIGSGFQKKWKKLPKKRRALLELISRFAVTGAQATRWYVAEERGAAVIEATDDEILANPYVLFELDVRQQDPIALETVDRGMFPDAVVRERFPVPLPSAPEDAIDERRVRALVVDTLLAASSEGHTVLPQAWVVTRVRARALSAPCPLDGDTLESAQEHLAGQVIRVETADRKPAFQLARYATTREVISAEVERRCRGKPHALSHDWRALVDEELDARSRHEPARAPGDVAEDDDAEERARVEKALALEKLARSRLCVLCGPAGTGKTTLLTVLCKLPNVDAGGILLLAPTGKARVRLEQQTGREGQGQTIAQLLLPSGRFDWTSAGYQVLPDKPRQRGAKTVIVDECSMLTEDQLAAVLDCLEGVERLILVGDPNQLPPIGAGRPFLDIIRRLEKAPLAASALNPTGPAPLPSATPGAALAELMVTRRQRGRVRDDLLLAGYFSGRSIDCGADEVWTRLAQGVGVSIRAVEWMTGEDLHEKVLAELVSSLKLSGLEDQATFELSIGGSIYQAHPQPFFWPAKNGSAGAASKVGDWQILSPVRGNRHGTDALNRLIQVQFRSKVRAMATPDPWYYRKIPGPMGPQAILWGDKVINVRNHGKRKTWPEKKPSYVANGDIGCVVGQYKTQGFKGVPHHLQVEFVGQEGTSYTFWEGEFGGDEGAPPLELAYALTVHKSQGSEFGKTFVIVPNPCRLLSREMLYTALTRQQEEIVVFHQGPLSDLWTFASSDRSQIAGRMTNLFDAPDPVVLPLGNGETFFEAGLIHRTAANHLVRSKSEVIIADKLHARGVRYEYEPKVTLAGQERRPDFRIERAETGAVFLWEHLGMMTDAHYRLRWKRKEALYRSAGILPLKEGGGPNGTLIVTEDDRHGGIDSAAIGQIVDEVILGGDGGKGEAKGKRAAGKRPGRRT